MNYRTYLFADDGVWRLQKHWFDRPVALPQYARTKQRCVTVNWIDDRGSIRYNLERGRHISFDDEGLKEPLSHSIWDAISLEATAKRMRVPDLRMIIRAKKIRDEWKLTDADEQLIVSDLLPSYDSKHQRIWRRLNLLGCV